MPQPLTSYDPTFLKSNRGLTFGHMGIGGGRPHPTFFGAHTKFAGLAMEVIAKWSNVENRTLMTVSRFLGGPDHDVYENFAGLRAKSPKTEVFKAVSQMMITPIHRDLVRRVLSFHSSCQKRRDAIAHHAWGFLNDDANVALLVDYKDWIGKSREEFLPKVMVWSVQDFERLAMDIVDLHKCIDLLSSLRQDRFNESSREARQTLIGAIEDKLHARGL